MQLPRSRTALRQATQAVEELRAAKDHPDLFRDRFVSAMGMALRVGSIIDEETKGHRTPAFGNWWKETQSDPLAFMQDVRNAEFKRGEARQAAHHNVTLGDAIEIESALSLKVIRGGEVIQEGGDLPREEPAATTTEPSAAPSSSYPSSGSSGAMANTMVRKSSPCSTATSLGCAMTSCRWLSG